MSALNAREQPEGAEDLHSHSAPLGRSAVLSSPAYHMQALPSVVAKTLLPIGVHTLQKFEEVTVMWKGQESCFHR